MYVNYMRHEAWHREELMKMSSSGIDGDEEDCNDIERTDCEQIHSRINNN